MSGVKIRLGWATLLAALLLAASVVLPGAPVRSVADDAQPVADQSYVVDPATYDYWNQIIQTKIPEVRDGAARYFPWGRYYLGPNGLEVRFNSEGTQWLTGLGIAASIEIGGPAVGKLVSGTTPMVGTALNRMSGLSWVLEFAAGQAAADQVHQCLGMTLPSNWVVDYFNNPINNLRAALSQQVPVGFGYDVPIWYEDCTS